MVNRYQVLLMLIGGGHPLVTFLDLFLVRTGGGHTCLSRFIHDTLLSTNTHSHSGVIDAIAINIVMIIIIASIL